MKELSFNEVIKAVKGEYRGNFYDLKVNDVSIDSRTVSVGNLFVDLKGDNFNGHHYIKEVIEKGCVLVLSQEDCSHLNLDERIIYVESTRQALMDLAEYYRSCFPIPAIAVTGSVGKTTTKDLIYDILSKKYSVLKTLSNYNNEVGLPLTIFRLDDTVEVIILEMGMNNFNEIHNLSKIVKPDIAVITNIGDAHIENLGSKDGILEAKMEITHFLKDDGVLIVSGDDEYLKKINNFNKKIIKVGIGFDNDIRCNDFKENGIDGIDISLVDKDRNNYLDLKVNIPGKHMIINSLIGYAIGKELKLTNEEITEGVKNLKISKMRMEIVKNKKVGFTIINDTYNANPVSMKAGLDVLHNSKNQGRKVAILGDMFELGADSKKYHYEVGKYAGELGVDVICVGELASHIYDGVLNNSSNEFSRLLYFFTDDNLMDNLVDMKFFKEDIVLVKASRGMKFENIVDFLMDIDEMKYI